MGYQDEMESQDVLDRRHPGVSAGELKEMAVQPGISDFELEGLRLEKLLKELGL